MVKQAQFGWNPDYAVPPGAVIAEHLEVRGWSEADLARRIGCQPQMVSEMISGESPVDPTTACALERVLGVKAEIWTNMGANWRTFRARTLPRTPTCARAPAMNETPLPDATCPACGALGGVVRFERREGEVVRGVVLEVTKTLRRCAACGEEFENSRDPDWRAGAYARLRADKD
ncbi:Helix-turn-helix domain-containing protein (plasmid) [Rhodovastum atsumiense]|nr:Helix-turn-helix domain-containing protein [Rhodovastum atsumiense]